MIAYLFLIILTCLVTYRWQTRHKRRVSDKIKSDLANLPLLGHSMYFFGNEEARMRGIKSVGRQAIKHGGISTMWLGSRFFVVVADAIEADSIMKMPACLEKDDILNFVRMLTGNGSIFAEVPIWRPRRKVLAPTFGMKNLNHFVNIFSEQSSIMADHLALHSGKEPFSIWQFVTKYTMDSVCETVLGTKLAVQSCHDHPFLSSFEKLLDKLAERLVQPWLHNDFVYKHTQHHHKAQEFVDYIINFVSDIIKKKRKEIKQNQIDQNETNHIDQNEKCISKSFLELLIESSGGDKGYTDLELQEETLVLLLAGTDTSAVGTCFTFLLLAKYQDVQEKVYAEIQKVMGDTERPVTPEDLPHFKYLDMVIKESLRLYPPVPVIARKTVDEVTLPSRNLTLTRDIGILMHIWAMHRNYRYWGEDAEIFRPERFVDHPPTHPAAFMPFSYGPRQCLGYQYAVMSMKTAIVSVLQKYCLKPAPYIDETKTLRVKYNIMLKHYHNFEIKIEHRK